MPELWLSYGAGDVVLDIKVENLNEFENQKFNNLEDQDLAQQLNSLPLEDMRIFAVEGSTSVARVISTLLMLARKSTVSNIPIECFPKDYSLLSKRLERERLAVSKDTKSGILERANDPKTVFISTLKLDPIFGFDGVPTKLLRECLKDKMAEAYNSRTTNAPCPGVNSVPLQIALDVCKNMSAKSIQVITSNRTIDSVFTGTVIESLENGKKRIESLYSADYYNTRSMIISADRDADSHLHLADSLKNLWNCVHILKIGGIGILLAENRNGFGSIALQRLAEGRLTFDEVYSTVEYIDGMEHLMFINELKEKYKLGILSSLPHYYLSSKLGFQTFSKTQDALAKLLELNGKAHKILVIPDPNLALLNYSN